MKNRRWKRSGRTYCFHGDGVGAYIFGAEPPLQLWAWAVWGQYRGKEGIEHSLKNARAEANKWIEAVQLADNSARAGVAENAQGIL